MNAEGSLSLAKRHTWICDALDGAQVEVRSPFAVGDATHSAMAELRAIGLASVEVCVSGLGWADDLARSSEISVGMRFDEAFGFQGGRLRLGAGRQPIGPDRAEYWERGPDGRNRRKLVNMAAWTGHRFELHIIQYGGDADRLIAILRQFRIRETRHGITCAPADPKQTFFHEGPTVILGIPGLGILEVEQLTKRAARTMPGHRGTQVAGGELYKGEMGPGGSYYLMRGRTAKATLVPEEVSSRELAAALEGLEVAWTVPR